MRHGTSTPSERLIYAQVSQRLEKITQANHDVYTLENVIDELHHDFNNVDGLACLIGDRHRIQAAADRLNALLGKMPARELTAAE